MQITEQWILAHAPAPTVAQEGRELSAGDGFLTRCRTVDALSYWGECVGSARNPYYVSVDCALSEKEPIYSCSCASPHFPCKHVLALMYDILDEKNFQVENLPGYVLKTRLRVMREREHAAARLEKARRTDAVAREKKLERQLSALAKAERMSNELLSGGLASISALPAHSLERLAAELGNCALPAARDVFERIALLDRQCRTDGIHVRQYRTQMLRALRTLRVLLQEGRVFLSEQLASESYSLENPLLYEALGGVWNDDELREIGSCRKSARLVQLSFDVAYDEAKRCYAERAFWLELTRGDMVYTRSLHASRSLNYAGTDDSCFALLEVPTLYESPVSPCPRVWWDSAAELPMSAADLGAVRSRSMTVSEAVDAALPQLKDPLRPDSFPVLFRAGALGTVDGDFVLADTTGGRIALRDRAADGAERASTRHLTALSRPLVDGDAVFGLLFFDDTVQQLCLHPYSLVTADEIIRLHY